MRALRYIFIFWAMAVICSCSSDPAKEENLSGENGKVSFSIEEDATKASAVTAGPSQVNGITLAAYNDSGLLADCRYFTSTSGMYLMLDTTSEYTILAFVNLGDKTASVPATLASAKEMTEVLSWGNINSSGFPMTGTAAYTAGSTRIAISVKRLLAKVSLTIDTEWPEGTSFSLKNVSVGNTNSSVSLFGESAATSSSDLISGDYTSSLTTPMTFYLPENLQGNLLPGNSDPLLKNRESLVAAGKESYADLCSYMDVTLTQEDTYGVSGDRRFRFYIGSDNTSNFDVKRNTNYNITLKLTYDGFNIQGNWKVDNDGVSDSRSLEFGAADYYTSAGETVYVDVSYVTQGQSDDSYSAFNAQTGWSFYDISESISIGGYVSGKGIAVTALSDQVSVGDIIPIYIQTFDGILKDDAYINISPGSVNTSWNKNFTPSYIAQKNTLSAEIPDGFDSVSFEVGEGSEDILEITNGSDGQSATVSCIGSGEGKIVIIGHISGKEMRLQELELSVSAPVLYTGSSSITVLPTGEETTLKVGYKSTTGTVMTASSTVGSRYFDKTLYERLLAPVSSFSTGDAGMFLGTSSTGVLADKVSYNGENILDYCGSTNAGTVTYSPVSTSVAEMVASVKVSCSIDDPFPGASSSRLFGYINNKYDGAFGSVATSALDITDTKTATFSTTVSSYSSGISLSTDIPDMTASYDSGKLTLSRKSGSDYSAGSYYVYGSIYNSTAAKQSATKILGTVESYLMTGFRANAELVQNNYNVSANFANRFNISWFNTIITKIKSVKMFGFYQGATLKISTQYYVFDHAEDDNGVYISPQSSDFYTWGTWCDVVAYDDDHLVAGDAKIYSHHIGQTDLNAWSSISYFFNDYSPLIRVDVSKIGTISGLSYKTVSTARLLYVTTDSTKGTAGVPYHVIGIPTSKTQQVSVPWNN